MRREVQILSSGTSCEAAAAQAYHIQRLLAHHLANRRLAELDEGSGESVNPRVADALDEQQRNGSLEVERDGRVD